LSSPLPCRCLHLPSCAVRCDVHFFSPSARLALCFSLSFSLIPPGCTDVLKFFPPHFVWSLRQRTFHHCPDFFFCPKTPHLLKVFYPRPPSFKLLCQHGFFFLCSSLDANGLPSLERTISVLSTFCKFGSAPLLHLGRPMPLPFFPVAAALL